MECNSCGEDVYDPLPCVDCNNTYCENCATMIMCECGKHVCNECINDHNC
jgi:hypothetical protein